MIVRYISAGDRLNYGDFLFSLIFKEYFKDTFDIEFYGIVESNYSYFGAIPTQSYKTLVKEINHEEDVVVIGGGEVFFPKWSSLYSFIHPTYSLFKRNRYLNKIDSLINLSQKMFYQTRNEFPFIPNLGCENIFISVGGQFTKKLNPKEVSYLKNVLSKSTFISVRDNRTYLSLKANDINTTKIPDSAVLMSKIYPLEELIKRLKNISLLNIDNQFIFLQLGKYKGPKNKKKFISDINQIAVEKKLTIICCPIGTAPGHEDNKLLMQFCKLDSSWRLVKPNNVFEIMYLIAKSELYIGTSLHGLITAFSFNKPAISMNKKVLKADSFIETWCSEFYEPSIDYEELSTKAKIVFQKWDKTKAHLQLEYCQKLVENYFLDIKKYLKEKRNYKSI